MYVYFLHQAPITKISFTAICVNSLPITTISLMATIFFKDTNVTYLQCPLQRQANLGYSLNVQLLRYLLQFFLDTDLVPKQ